MGIATSRQSLSTLSSGEIASHLAHIFLCSGGSSGVFILLLPNSARLNESSDYIKYYNPVAQNFLSGKVLVWTPPISHPVPRRIFPLSGGFMEHLHF